MFSPRSRFACFQHGSLICIGARLCYPPQPSWSMAFLKTLVCRCGCVWNKVIANWKGYCEGKISLIVEISRCEISANESKWWFVFRSSVSHPKRIKYNGLVLCYLRHYNTRRGGAKRWACLWFTSRLFQVLRNCQKISTKIKKKISTNTTKFSAAFGDQERATQGGKNPKGAGGGSG